MPPSRKVDPGREFPEDRSGSRQRRQSTAQRCTDVGPRLRMLVPIERSMTGLCAAIFGALVDPEPFEPDRNDFKINDSVGFAPFHSAAAFSSKQGDAKR